MHKYNFLGKVIRTTFSDLETDANHLKLKWINKKTKDIFLFLNASVDYRTKTILVSTQKYFNGAHM